MFIAIIATLITIVVAFVVIAIVFSISRRRRSANVTVKKDVRSVASVGVSTTLPEASQRVAGSGSQARNASPKGLTSRFAAFGVLAVAIFGALTAKLWTMQIVEQKTYRQESDENQYSTVYSPAPRGYILDADGNALVKNRPSLTVLADPDVADNHDVMARLSAVLGVPLNVVRKRIQDITGGAQNQRVVAKDISTRNVAFISEHADAFPGVSIQTRTVRDYPYGALAAHAVGYTGPVTSDDLKNVAKGRDIKRGDEVGRAGIESSYDSLLAGDHGERKVVVDTHGNVKKIVSETQPVKGSDVYLTIKAPVQYVCENALAKLIAPEGGTIGTGTGTAGAVVVMNVQDGSIIALASYPTFAPETFIGGISQDTWDSYQTPESHNPMLNRTISGQYPAASTYKTFTGLAALANGFADTTKTWDCPGHWDGFKTGHVQMCWKHSGHGILNFRGGVVNSCDVVFYWLAYGFYVNSPQGGGSKVGDTAMQDYLAKFRFGQASGIDLGGEAVGRIPTPAWKADYFRDTPEEAAWRGGDSTNMVIGQGYVLVTPLQIAVAYGSIATGKLMKPHLLKEVRNAGGDVAVSFKPEVVTTPDVDPTQLGIMRDALRGVAVENADIATPLRAQGLDPTTVACKTGTAEVAGKNDYAWFACYAPYDNPKFVVVCVVEEGGGGSATGAPLGAEVLAATLANDTGNLSDIGRVAGSTGKSIAYKGPASGRTD